ncbi:hypothetical protein GGX14DRAFT_644655 [Mycena pura]|uniref:Zn(2)-C6 fungal-type domain-containing protein n=1 Tax=Mycena pura TaxID=153505 RepID=A0AAD6VF84_9AGAR|nr:hypothetical protein GGX14DRAFT_644655 [Mycena pura]
MSSSYSYSHAQYHAPPVPQRRRITCLSCRQNRITCKPQSPHSPCERCARKNLLCQYVAVAEDRDYDEAAASPSSNPASSRSHSSYPSPAPVPTLPYTSAPPMNSRPRYSGAAYPDLSLASGRPAPATVPAQHHGYPAQHAAPSAHPGPQASRSRHRPSTAWANTPAQPQWPAAPPAPQYPNPAVYGQPQSYAPMPFFADTAMPEQQQYEWSGLG